MFDLLSALVTDSTMIKIYAWYDNEMGYANQMNDVAQHIFANRVWRQLIADAWIIRI